MPVHHNFWHDIENRAAVEHLHEVTVWFSRDDSEVECVAVGNTATAALQVTIIDTTPPVLTAPPPLTAYTGPDPTSCVVVVDEATLGMATASDGCSGEVTITRDVPAGHLYPVGTTAVTWKAEDAAGNTATQTVTVIDTTAPKIRAPPPLTAYTAPDAASCGAPSSTMRRSEARRPSTPVRGA